MQHTLIRFLLAWSLIATCLLFMQRSIIDEQEKPLLVYQADNQGSEIKGIVSDKKKIGSLYTITVNGNVFVINEQKYQKIKIGDEVKF